MNGEHLHNFDIHVCNYVIWNIRQYLDHPEFAAEVLSDIPPRLATYLLSGLHQVVPDRLLLDDVELDSLEPALRLSQPVLDRFWVPSDMLHSWQVYCVREIQDVLTRQDAEDWSQACARYARRLNEDGLHVYEGIEIVHEWINHIRRLKRAMGATQFLPHPHGSFPTPTMPTPLMVNPKLHLADQSPTIATASTQQSTEDRVEKTFAENPFEEVLSKVHQVFEVVSTQRLIRDFYSTEQAANYFGKAPWTVREWCRQGRVNADKRFSGRGRSPEWVISHAEMLRIEQEGLLPLPKN